MAIRDFYDWDSTIFDGVVVPAGLDRELVINQIMMDCGLMDSYYITPSVFKMAVTQWFATHQWNFEHLIKVVEATYSPIENTDRYSEHIIGRNRNENEDVAGYMASERQVSDDTNRSDTRKTEDNLDNNINTTGTTDSETTVSAFNSDSYQPDTKVEGSNSSQTDSVTNEEITEEGSGEEHTTHSETNSEGNTVNRNGSSDEIESYNEHTHGNIGVTTNQQMINEELALMKSFNLYQFISNMFMDDFCIMVW